MRLNSFHLFPTPFGQFHFHPMLGLIFKVAAVMSVFCIIYLDDQRVDLKPALKDTTPYFLYSMAPFLFNC